MNPTAIKPMDNPSNNSTYKLLESSLRFPSQTKDSPRNKRGKRRPYQPEWSRDQKLIG